VTPADRFHNALRILNSIQEDDLRAAGVIDENWGTPEASDRDQLLAFVVQPSAEALRMPDANFDRLFALIESHQPQKDDGILFALRWALQCVPFPSDCHSAIDDAIAKAEGRAS
jgi:hypothetical protein